jgi:hypothetical protein
MTEMDFDMQAAWLRRFNADAESNLKAFALRLKSAMPDLVTVHEQRGFFAKSGNVTGVSIELGENRYRIEIERGRLTTTVSMVVRGIVLHTKDMAPAEWFARLYQEAHAMSEHAQHLSRSLAQFMAEQR